MTACKVSKLSIINLLLKSGASVNATDAKGDTAVIYLLQSLQPSSPECFRLLGMHDADMYVISSSGQSVNDLIEEYKSHDTFSYNLLGRYNNFINHYRQRLVL